MRMQRWRFAVSRECFEALAESSERWTVGHHIDDRYRAPASKLND